MKIVGSKHSVIRHSSFVIRPARAAAQHAKRTDIQSILIIGAGPIIIGQACEFDYSGAQACKALREEGLKVIPVNSNPATIATDPEMADVTYIEPITAAVVERIIAKEKPDALLPTMGSQTALNTAMELSKNGALKRHNVELIGANEACHRESGGSPQVQGGDDQDWSRFRALRHRAIRLTKRWPRRRRSASRP